MNSLSKVLFNFPSRYLFAIGLAVVFSLGWSLPPTWGCTPKQPDSPGPPRLRRRRAYGPGTLFGPWPRSRGLARGLGIWRRRQPGWGQRPGPHTPHSGARDEARAPRRFGDGLFPLRSPLLRESSLVSFPPLSDMLKLSGYSRPIRGRNKKNHSFSFFHSLLYIYFLGGSILFKAFPTATLWGKGERRRGKKGVRKRESRTQGEMNPRSGGSLRPLPSPFQPPFCAAAWKGNLSGAPT